MYLVPLRAAAAAFLLLATSTVKASFLQTNLVTDNQSITPANNTDPNLINPWGISFSTLSPFWVSDQGGSPGAPTQRTTLYNGAGAPLSLVVSIPPSGSFGPTGQVSNSTSGFVLSDGSPASFIFANLNGSVDAWNGGLGTTAQVAPAVPGASFTGLALANNLLYAADKGDGTIDIFNSSFGLASMLTDPNLPGFTPYNIQLLSDGRLYVTFENKSNPNVGAVEILNANGTFQTLVPSTSSVLKEPWGLALAPSTFGSFGGDLLVGNKSNGTINAFNPATGAFVGTLMDANGNPIADPGLWGIAFGNGSQGFDPNVLYFAAGVGFVPGGLGNDIYAHGLFGEISVVQSAVPEPSIAILTGLGILAVFVQRLKCSKRK
ncbi:MAG TPA: TIGR03118 family protein [Bryobacteraceae bacterium]|nr:TIGR03118 family protein [Bryobacteraceae bacterium]